MTSRSAKAVPAEQQINDYVRYKSYEVCKFPFVHNGRAHYGCTKDPLDGNPKNLPWCSTKTNSSTYEHIPGNSNWGLCKDANCANPKCFKVMGE